jgi:hypothetical protein
MRYRLSLNHSEVLCAIMALNDRAGTHITDEEAMRAATLVNRLRTLLFKDVRESSKKRPRSHGASASPIRPKKAARK